MCIRDSIRFGQKGPAAQQGPGQEDQPPQAPSARVHCPVLSGDLGHHLGCAVAVSYTHLDVYKRQALTIAMRTGEVGVVTPFRYTRLLFAMVLGIAVFGERPDAATLIGSAIIVACGVVIISQNRRIA